MSAGFCILTFCRPLVRNVWSLFSATDGISSRGDGLCELFIDRLPCRKLRALKSPVTGVLTGIYMLLSGAIANYLAGVIADQTSQASV